MILDMSFEEEYCEIDPVTKIHEKGNYYSSNQFGSGIDTHSMKIQSTKNLVQVIRFKLNVVL